VSNAFDLRSYFIAYDRDYYSYEAYEAMLDYNEQACENVELDVIALCGDFNEEKIEDIIDNFNIDINDDEDKEEQVLEYLYDRTWATKTIDDKILYLSF
jgi:adenylate cyclase class IV